MIAFTLSCVAILLYLWLVFGGSVPLRPEGYRFEVNFPEATQLAQEADVRISGVNVGKVKKKEPDHNTGLTRTVLELDNKYAPIPADTKAILRQKTLLGETYVELAPGDRNGKRLPDGGTLASSQVSPTVELDEIFRTFDPRTRKAFSVWLSEQGQAVGDGGQSLNDALGALAPFSENVGDTLKLLDEQSAATRGVVRDTGAVFEALSEREGQLQGLVRNSNRVFQTTAQRNRELADTFVVFPTFLRETRETTRRLSQFAEDTDPLVTQLRPFARQFSPTLVNLKGLAPDLKGVMQDLDPLIDVSRAGLPALERSLDDTKPLLARLDPFLRDLQPVFDYLGLYKRELTAFFANSSAATNASDPSVIAPRPLNYLRTTNPLNPEALAAYDQRIATNRSNPYPAPGSAAQRPMPLFGDYLCPPAGAPNPRLAPTDPNLDPALRAQILQFVFTPTGPVGPPCRSQPPLGRTTAGQTGVFPQLRPIAP